MMTNETLSDQFALLARLMELHGENAFKISSYQKAARTLESLPEELSTLAPETWQSIPGVGDAIAKKIAVMMETGQMPQLLKLLEATPPGVLEMLSIKGLGPKKIQVIWKDMGLLSPGELLYACQENRLVDYKGFGAKTQANVEATVAYYLQGKGSLLWAEAEPKANELMDLWGRDFGSEPMHITGAFPRQMEVVSSFGLLTTMAKEKVEKWIASQGATETEKGWQLPGWPALEIHVTGASNLAAEQLRRNSSPEFWEVVKAAGVDLSANEENALFASIDAQPVPTPLRENPVILKLAQQKSLPELIQEKSIRGLIHSHSKWSDGANTLEEMAKACIAKGWEYMLITDHSRTASYAGGLQTERVLAQWKEIETLNQKLAPFRIFKGIESDILGDGSLDYPAEILAGFDLIIASVHQNLRMTEELAMQRLLTAIANPYTSILGHMTGRLLLSRPGYPVDHEVIIGACKEHNVVIELNAHPRRLDIDWRFLGKALEAGVITSINPDAHYISGLNDVRYGVLVAQKAGLTAGQNLSSFSLAEMEAFIAAQHKKRPA